MRWLWYAVGVVLGLYTFGYLFGWVGLAVLAFLVAVGALGVAAYRCRVRPEVVVALVAGVVLAVAGCVVVAAMWPAS